MPRTISVSLRLTPAEASIIDEHRGGLSRSGYLRACALDNSRSSFSRDGDNQPSYNEAIRLLREASLAGSVSARIGYERALRSARRIPGSIGDDGDELERLLRDD